MSYTNDTESGRTEGYGMPGKENKAFLIVKMVLVVKLNSKF